MMKSKPCCERARPVPSGHDSEVLTSPNLARALRQIAPSMDAMRDQLNAADRELGDGDTGMTVADIVAAWTAASERLPQDVGEALTLLGRAAGRATGSSLGAVTAVALTAGGKATRGLNALDREALVVALAAATTAISDRSGATAGDKSVLDSLLQIHAALDAASTDEGMMKLATDAAIIALDEFRERQCRLGRARMYGARTVGRDDPGMLAVSLLLQAMA
jgi:dihydroxyacetone kinase-like protein